MNSVDKVEVAPVIKYQAGLDQLIESEEDEPKQNGGQKIQNDEQKIQNGQHKKQNGVHETLENEEEMNDDAPVNIITGADWESVNYKVDQVVNLSYSVILEKKECPLFMRKIYLILTFVIVI